MLRANRLSPRWRARLITLLAVYFTFLGGTFVTDLNFWPRVAHHAIVTLLLAGWAISLLRRGESLPATSLSWPLLAMLGAYALATALAVDPRVSVESLWQVGFHVLLFFLLVDMMRTWNPRAVLEPIFFASAVVIVVGLIEFISWYFGLGWLPMFRQGWFPIGGLSNPLPPFIYRLSFTLGVSTFLSGYLALLIPVGLAWAVSTRSQDTRRGLGLWLAGALAVEVLSFSRGGLLSLAASLPTFGLLYVVGLAGWQERIRLAARDWRVGVGAVAMLAALALGGLVWMRQAALGGHSSGDAIRMDLWRSAWQIGLTHPLTGVGPYGFGRAMRLFRDPTVTADHFTSAHNVPLQVWAEVGLVGVVTLGVLATAVALVGLRRWREASGAERIRLAGVMAALAGFATQNQVDTLFYTPILLPCLALVAFLAAPLRPAAEATPARQRRVVPAILLGIVGLSAVGWALSDAAQYHFTQAIRLAASNDLNGAIQAIQTATRLDPAMGYYAEQRAQYLGEKAARDERASGEALAAYETALGYENTYALIRANYAMLLAQSGETRAARDEMQSAQKLDPNEPRYLLWTGALAEQAGDQETALSAYQEALEVRPQWVESAYWEATPLRTEARAAFLAAHGLQNWTPEALGTLTPKCWPGEPPVERNIPSLSAADTFYCKGEISLRIQHDAAAAVGWLDQAIQADASQATSYLARAEAHLAVGDDKSAERDARTAILLGLDRAYGVLGQLAEKRGDLDTAVSDYQAAGPVIYEMQGWDVAVYNRRGDLSLLPLLDAPGPTRYDFGAWLALIDLYRSQGRDQDAQKIRDTILSLDPYFVFEP